MQIFYRAIAIAASLFFITGCDHATPAGQTVKDTTAAAAPQPAVQGSATDDAACEQLVYQLIASTGTFYTITTSGDSLHMHTPADSLNYFIEAANDSVINVKLSHDHEVEPGAVFDQADAFMTIDLRNGKVFDASANVDPPQETSFDKALMNKLQNCHLSR